MAERGVRQAIENAAQDLRGSGGLVRTFIRHPNAANLLMMLMILLGVHHILEAWAVELLPIWLQDLSVSL